MAEVTITKENFDAEVRNYKGTMLIDLWAGWCGPCMKLAPVIEEIADELDGKIKVGKINVDEQPELAVAFGVQSIPMLVVVKNGIVMKKSVGYQSKDMIMLMLK